MGNKQAGRGVQFSLRSLVVAIVALSVLFALLFAAPDWVATATAFAITPLTLAGLVGAIIYGRGDVRAFCIGALFPAAMAAMPSIYIFILITPSIFATEHSEVLETLERLSVAMTVDAMAGLVLSLISGTMTLAIRRCFSHNE